MKTKCYFDRSKKISFEANVIDCIKENSTYWIGLDETCFYYEAGGMSSDSGTLNDFVVSAVKEKNGIVYHLVSQELVGKVVGLVDEDGRKEKVQIHTAQHLISYLFEKNFETETMSHHVSEDVAYIEFSLAECSQEKLNEMEILANKIIEEDIEVGISYPTKEEIIEKLGAIKIEHEINRVVSIGEYDYNLCGCMHVESTAEIKAIQLLGFSKSKYGIRVEYIAGNQLLRYFKNRIPVLQASSFSLALPQTEIFVGIEKLKESNKQLEYELSKIRRQYCDLLVQWELSQFSDTILVRTYEDLEVKDLQYLAGKFVTEHEIAVVLQLRKGNQAHIIMAKNEKIESFHAKALFEDLKSDYEYKGGGNDKVAQGGGQAIEALQTWVMEHL